MVSLMQADKTYPVRHAHIAEAVVYPAEFGGIITNIPCERLFRVLARGYQLCQEVTKWAPMGWNPELWSLLRSICAIRHILDTHHITRANDQLIFFNQLVEKLADAHLDEDQVMEHLAYGPSLGSRFVVELGLGEPLDAIKDALPVGISE